MQSKLNSFFENSLFPLLGEQDRIFLEKFIEKYSPSVQEIRQLVIIARDFCMWGDSLSDSVSDFSREPEGKVLKGKDSRKYAVSLLVKKWEEKKRDLRIYPKEKISKNSTGPIFSKQSSDFPKNSTGPITKHSTIWGRCPVASEGTRCCNLYTLDAVVSCAFDCSYCTIQSFYRGAPAFRDDLRERLDEIKLDSDKHYHIGTGQGSDSLLWGNKNGLLDNLAYFARKHSQIILEMKTKSDNIDWFLKNEVPPNIVVTWSLNPQGVVLEEEKGTATLDERLFSARKLADRGIPVGFHFHPMVYFRDWQQEYGDIISRLQDMFLPQEVVQVSFGTLTFIKPVLKKIRQRMDLYSRILRMPFEEINGKFSYPFEIKKELFSFAYHAFSSEWKDSVFFYMCMEDLRLWEPVFGRIYPSNEEFEEDMYNSYRKKMGLN